VTLSEAAQILDVTRTRLDRYLHAGKLQRATEHLDVRS
jgi:predicted site-specific integrase-resolvase